MPCRSTRCGESPSLLALLLFPRLLQQRGKVCRFWHHRCRRRCPLVRSACQLARECRRPESSTKQPSGPASSSSLELSTSTVSSSSSVSSSSLVHHLWCLFLPGRFLNEYIHRFGTCSVHYALWLRRRHQCRFLQKGEKKRFLSCTSWNLSLSFFFFLLVHIVSLLSLLFLVWDRLTSGESAQRSSGSHLHGHVASGLDERD